MKSKFGIISLFIALGLPIGLFAHHGSAIYDETKAVTVRSNLGGAFHSSL